MKHSPKKDTYPEDPRPLFMTPSDKPKTMVSDLLKLLAYRAVVVDEVVFVLINLFCILSSSIGMV